MKVARYTVIVIYLILLGNSNILSMGKLDTSNFVIVSDKTSIERFLTYEGVRFDDIWIPTNKDLIPINKSFKTYLKSKIKVTRDSIVLEGYNYISKNLTDYKREFCGIIRDNKKLIFCSMYLGDFEQLENETKENKTFTLIMDGGSSVVRFIFDIEKQEILELEWNREF